MKLELNIFPSATIWLDELPDARYTGSSSIERELHASGEPVAYSTIAVELMALRGARFVYALLGGTFKPDKGRSIVVKIVKSDEANRPRRFDSRFTTLTDELIIGLPPDYAVATLEGIESALRDSPLPAGTLVTDVAVYGRWSSSVMAFRHVGTVLIRLLRHCRPGACDEPVLASLLKPPS